MNSSTSATPSTRYARLVFVPAPASTKASMGIPRAAEEPHERPVGWQSRETRHTTIRIVFHSETYAKEQYRGHIWDAYAENV